ncbi:LuxR C-terminal-related transcriptional regulator [Parvibaculum sp.]|uniref:helix-turn-helix transcriptional regulator n=1 Tax=Parvibaculum sp. TaxID=2024848 RepID=UPI001B034FCF|nr:LuxR C-terminal-related transcriptional regulator [Parvibaculum sp.]MBO6633004.1 hypothetical protein [Parvibaculum sp.]MBO6679389.1 hypothetical protein [Parvibaculum sp.]MBO6684420.1 hypothetical protein [Parvibaculum sp.]MBO6904216.1 hypothetical protein [Parvibaculum sp.]
MSDDLRSKLYAGALGHEGHDIHRRIAEIKEWAQRNDNEFVERMLAINPRLEWTIPQTGRDPIPEDYVLAFGFTRAEAEIAVSFVLGHSITKIAEQRGCSVNTVRTQFARIKDKLGKSSQTDVLRELMKV